MEKSKAEIGFNEEEVSLLENAVDMASGFGSRSIESADLKVKAILANREYHIKELGKESYNKRLSQGIKDWDDAMTYFYVYRSISDRLKKLRWKHKELIEK